MSYILHHKTNTIGRKLIRYIIRNDMAQAKLTVTQHYWGNYNKVHAVKISNRDVWNSIPGRHSSKVKSTDSYAIMLTSYLMTPPHRATMAMPGSCQDTISFTLWSPGNQPGTRLSSDMLVGDTSRSWLETSPGTTIGVCINLQTGVTHL